MLDFDLKIVDEVEEIVKACIENPGAFLNVQEKLSEDLKKATKKLYDLAAKNRFLKNENSEALPELIIDGFDTEQIWQQIEIANNEVLNSSNLKNIFEMLDSKQSLVQDLEEKESKHSDDSNNKNDEKEDDEEKDDEEKDDEEKDDEECELPKTSKKEKHKIENKIIPSKAKKRKTEVDDKFFKLNELNEYLKREDKRETGSKSQNKDSSDEEMESINLFDNLSDSDEEENEEDEIKNGRSLKYADFFDNPESGDEYEQNLNSNNSENENENDDEDDQDNEDGLSEKSSNSKYENENMSQTQKLLDNQKRVKFNLLQPSDDDSDSTNDSTLSDKEKEIIKDTQSSLEKRQERLSKKIKQLEKESIAEKPWQLKGETNASSRPQNSLLEEYVEFDSVSRPAPVMTEQTTMKLEDIIRGRIKDQAWDDVEKKFKPIDTPMEYKRKLIMNQEKSKESLAQIYENEYIKQREALNANDKDEQQKEEPPEHIEIKEQMHSLFRKLDALCNFHYTPKPAKPEIKIISNVPAIEMEEVAPVAMSEANLLAPEEVKSKHKGDLIGKSERTKTDMKRERRKKKLKQHTRYLNESKKLTENVKQKKSLNTKVSSNKLKGRNIINVDQTSKSNGKSLKSSTAFFAQLQDQVDSSIKLNANKTELKKKKNKNTISAVKLKL